MKKIVLLITLSFEDISFPLYSSSSNNEIAWSAMFL